MEQIETFITSDNASDNASANISNREKSINEFLKLVKNDDDNNPILQGLYTKRHPTEPLVIATYGKVKNIKKHTENDACRGLVLQTTNDKNNSISVISRGFDRFIPKYRSPDEKLVVKRATIKEDGSLMFMFKYKDSWHLSTMHDFADNMLPFGDITYADLFCQIINQPLNNFAENLISQFERPDKVMTFCFEMCSPFNRIIKLYSKPTLFLLAVFGNDDFQSHGSTEFIIPPNIALPENVQLVQTVDVPQNITFQDATNKVIELSRDDITFEGVVLECINPESPTLEPVRVKVKNPFYLIQHTLKYRSWSKCTAQMMVPLILDKLDDIIINNVFSSLGGRDKVFEYEIKERVEYFTQRIAKEYETILMVINQLVTMEFMTKADYAITLQTNYPNICKVWGSLFFEIFEDIKNVKKKNFYLLNITFKKHMIHNIDKIFPIDPFIDKTHPNHCCEMTQENIPEDIQEFENDGISKKSDRCYCGNKMIVHRLKNDVTRYRYCHCGSSFGYLTYGSGTWLSQCSDPECMCTHEVDQHTQKPLGKPACIFTKNLRLNVHELIDNSELTKSECYDIISNITNKQKSDAHMARFGISDCIKVLLNFKIEEKKYKIQKEKTNEKI